MPDIDLEPMKLLVAALAAAMLSSAVQGQEHVHTGAYFCADEFGGGLRFDEARNKWLSTTFNADDKFIVRVAPHPREPVFMGSPAYSVTVGLMGDDPHACRDRAAFFSPTLIGDEGMITCSTVGVDYRINLRSLRFLSAYWLGYVDGTDAPGNTPWMMGGTCSKIE